MTMPKPLVRSDFLAEAKNRLGVNVKSATGVNQERLLSIDPEQDACVLGHKARTPNLTNGEDIKPLPLFGANGVVHTIHDLAEGSALKPNTEYVRYQDWCITHEAIESAVWWASVIDKRTKGLIADFRAYLNGNVTQPQASAINLSKQVCAWGGGRVRVSGHREKPEQDLERLLRAWFFDARDGVRTQALEDGLKFKGLRASFASKHLRFINPKRYATLDNILSQAFGFPMTSEGYEAFLQSLEAFKADYQLPYCIADIEHGLFFLAQPFFSSSPPQEHKPYSDQSPFFGGMSTAALARDYERVTAFSPVIDIYHSKGDVEHWYGLDRCESQGRRAIKFLLLVDPISAEVSHFSLASNALNMRQTRDYLHHLYPLHSASKAMLAWPNS